MYASFDPMKVAVFHFCFLREEKQSFLIPFFFTYAAHISLLLPLKIYRIHLSQSEEEWERKWNVNVNTFPTDKHGVTEGVNGRCAKKVSRGEKALKEGGE